MQCEQAQREAASVTQAPAGADRDLADIDTSERCKENSKPSQDDTEFASEPETDGKTELDRLVERVDAYIEQSTFGDYGDFIRPFSMKFKQGLRTKFPEDIEIYDRVDANELHSYGTALLLRFSTFILYVLNSFVFVYATCFLLGVGGAELDGMAGEVLRLVETVGIFIGLEIAGGIGGFFGGIIVAFAVFWTLRQFFRQYFLTDIREGVASMAAFTIGRLNGLNAAVTNALDRSDSDRQPRSEWPRKASDWIRVALWLEERYEEVDRYISATAWRVENAFRRIESVFRTMNVLISLGVVYIIWQATNVTEMSGAIAPAWGATALYLIFSLWAWSFGLMIGKRRIETTTGNSLWRDVFVEKFSDFDKDKRHVFDRIADRVSNDKTTIIDSSPRLGP